MTRENAVPLGLFLILSYLASVLAVTVLLRLLADPYQHFSNRRDWADCFAVALLWPWQLLRLLGDLVRDWWQRRGR